MSDNCSVSVLGMSSTQLTWKKKEKGIGSIYLECDFQFLFYFLFYFFVRVCVNHFHVVMLYKKQKSKENYKKKNIYPSDCLIFL